MMVATDYLKFLERLAKEKKQLKVVCDASDGSTGPFLTKLHFRNINLKVLNARPNGNFPAHGPDPSNERSSRQLSKEVKKNKADFGAIFDGDGDRVFFVDELGHRIPPDAIAFLISKNFKPPYIVTEISGYLFRRSMPVKAIKISRVGHYYIKKEMRRFKIKFAAEISGHYYFEQAFGKRRAYYDSALRALVEFANAVSQLKAKKLTLSNWLHIVSPPCASGELNFKVKNQEMVLRRIKKAYIGKKISILDGVTVDGADFWLNVRPSQTEPLLRLNLESKNKKVFSGELKRIEKLIRG
jgi:phosphomannomutase